MKIRASELRKLIREEVGVLPEKEELLFDDEPKVDEVAPPGWEGTVKAMKKHPGIENPWALAWSMKNKGAHSHKHEGRVPSLREALNVMDIGQAADKLDQVQEELFMLQHEFPIPPAEAEPLFAQAQDLLAKLREMLG